MSNLAKRALSAIILGPLFLYIIYKGGEVFFFITLFMFFIMFYEWFSITSKAKHRLYWALMGFIYLGLSFVTFIFLERVRFHEVLWGLERPPFWLLIILLLVWVNDIFCYIFGKLIGGPKLAPKISPNKTWSGAIGGILGGILLYILINYVTDFGAEKVKDRQFYIGLIMYIAIPVVAQIGDLFESYIKRRFGVKDSGNIIPGHGGVLDRMDGLLLVLFCHGIYLFIYPLLRLQG